MGPVQAMIKKTIAKRVKGPDASERARGDVRIVGEVRDSAGNRKALRLYTTEGYTLTAESAVKAAIKVAAGAVRAGAQTPSMAFGADYVLGLSGTRLEKIAT